MSLSAQVPATQKFQAVTICVPVEGCKKDLSQWSSNRSAGELSGIEWALYGAGDLIVNRYRASCDVVFSAIGGQQAPLSIPLGSITGAEARELDGCSHFVVSTTNSLHRLLRISFQFRGDDTAFESILQVADLAPAADEVAITELRHAVCSNYRNRLPLFVGGVELVQKTQNTMDELCWRGAAVLLDPPETHIVGEYKLLFFCSRSPSQPVLQLAIGPHLNVELAGCSLELSARGEPQRSLLFASVGDCMCFSRDLRVRQKLMVLAGKTARGVQEMGTSSGELPDCKRAGPLVAVQRWIARIVCFLCVLLLLQFVVLTCLEPQVSPLEAAATVAGTTFQGTSAVFGTVISVASGVLQFFAEGLTDSVSEGLDDHAEPYQRCAVDDAAGCIPQANF